MEERKDQSNASTDKSPSLIKPELFKKLKKTKVLLVGWVSEQLELVVGYVKENGCEVGIL